MKRLLSAILGLLSLGVLASTAHAVPVAFPGTAGDDTIELIALGSTSVEWKINGTSAGGTSGVTSVDVAAGDGNDMLIIDQSAAVLALPGGINYAGQGNSGPSGDSLVFVGGATSFATFSFANDSDGTIDVGGMATITYTGLEPILFGMAADALVFDYRSNGVDTITLSDAAIAGQMSIDSTLGESVTFNLPLAQLTILFDANDTFNIQSLDSAFDPERLLINPVPLPAAFWLFGTAFLGLAGFVRRRRRRS